MENISQDTIVAISTAPGRAALSLVRLSGPQAFAIADRIFLGRVKPSAMGNHTLQHGYIISQRGQKVDEVVLAVFIKPHSYTGEDTVEITCHGGRVMAEAIVEVAVVAGARPARPGEFSLRAFLNGRLDLAQAEAVVDVISADTWAAARAALERLQGGLSRRIEKIRDTLLDVLAQLEAAIDFPEEDLPAPVLEEMNTILASSLKDLEKLLKESRTTRLLRDGAEVVIIGRPNTGKSSLFNLILREERAIVTEEPGTTRDVLEGYIEIRGLPVRLFDTAGIRTSPDRIEAVGMERARGKLSQADLILLVMDGSQPPRSEDKSLLDETKGMPRLVVLNKSDLKPAFAAQRGWIRISALTGSGLEGLERGIWQKLSGGVALDSTPAAAANARQFECLARAKGHLEETLSGLRNNRTYELLAEDIKAAVRALDGITGREVGEEVLRRIFERFCIGK